MRLCSLPSAHNPEAEIQLESCRLLSTWDSCFPQNPMDFLSKSMPHLRFIFPFCLEKFSSTVQFSLHIHRATRSVCVSSSLYPMSPFATKSVLISTGYIIYFRKSSYARSRFLDLQIPFSFQLIWKQLKIVISCSKPKCKVYNSK